VRPFVREAAMIDAIVEFLGRLGRAAFWELLNFDWLRGTRVERLLNYAFVICIAGIIGYLWITRGL
jgi:hypothetical protein